MLWDTDELAEEIEVLANRQFFINAISVRLVANEAMQLTVVFILDSVDRVGSCDLALEAHNGLDDAGDSLTVAQNCKPLSFFDRKRDTTGSSGGEHVLVHVDNVGLLKVGSNILRIDEFSQNELHVLKLVDLQEGLLALIGLLLLKIHFLLHHDLPISIFLLFQTSYTAAAVTPCMVACSLGDH